MSGRAAFVTGSAAAAVVALRLRRARHLAGRLAGDPEGVRTEDGVRLHVEGSGPTDAPVTVVLVHGLAADASGFDPLCRALQDSVRIVRYDQRGHGRSGWAAPWSATVRQLGRDLGRVLEERAPTGPVVLAGHSLGGMAVLALLRDRPELLGERVAGVALLSTTAGPLDRSGPLPGALRLALRAGLGPLVARLLWAAAPVVQWVGPFRRPAGRRWLRGRLFAADPPERAVAAMAGSWADTPLGVVSAFLPGLAAYAEHVVARVLGAVPVLVLAGTDDATFAAGDARRLARLIGPAARLVLVPGAGHMVPLTHPGAVTAALQELLARVRATTGGRRAS
ncbi:alpha/beta fold hydrolase [Geodermatophilus sp. SYSU D01176]